MKFTAAGDVIIQRRMLPDFEGVKELKPFIERGDARFFNLETTLNREGTCPGSQFSGGTYIRAEKEMFEDVLAFGFNITTFNNNHAMDFSYEGLSATLEALNENGITHAGVGNNLAEASAPKYLETKNGRVALISVSTSFNPVMKAGKKSEIYPGRRGVNGISITKKYLVPKEDIAFINALAEKTNANAAIQIDRRDGYAPALPENQAEFANLRFEASDSYGMQYIINEHDMARLKKSIEEAKFQADYVILSIHSHQIDGETKENVPEFLKTIAHTAIDCGVNGVIGHGPHLLRPIEVYRETPVFYSLGDFIMELYSVPSAPEDFYANYALSSESTMYELIKKRSKNFTQGLMAQRVMLQSVVPYWEIENGKLTSLELLPVELEMGTTKELEGLPRIAKDLGFIQKLDNMSKPYGVEMSVNKNGVVVCKWEKT